MPRHPLNLGSTSLEAPEPPPIAPFWTPILAGGLNWNGIRARQIPRFEHIYAQESGGDQQFKKVNLDAESEG